MSEQERTPEEQAYETAKAHQKQPATEIEAKLADQNAQNAAHGVVGDGAHRYGEEGEIPPSGSEESWSAERPPGYQSDPNSPFTGKKVLAGALLGLIVLGAGVWAGTRLLTGRSSNGFGAASWTAAVKQNGAVIAGINAQNSGVAPPVKVPSGVTFGSGGGAESATVTNAITTCNAATGNTGTLTTSTGTTATIGTWSIQATPSVDSLKADAASLGTALGTQDPTQVANAASAFCQSFEKIKTLPAMPDAAGAKAWNAGIAAYAQAASNALKGVSGEPSALQTAADDLKLGNEQLTVLSARIIAATA